MSFPSENIDIFLFLKTLILSKFAIKWDFKNIHEYSKAWKQDEESL